jgi:hypothetical protein
MQKKTKTKRQDKSFNFEVDRALQDLGCPEPHIFLALIQAGVDPRFGPGQVHELVQRGADNLDATDQFPAEVCQQLMDLVLHNPLFEGEIIPLQDSTMAARELLSYRQPKLKAVQVTGDMEHLVKVKPLTEDEIKKFDQFVFEEF